MTWSNSKGRGVKYGAAHQAERKARLLVVRPGDPCGYCGRPLPVNTRTWHLPHNTSGTGYLPGMWHAACNLREAASRAARIANARAGQMSGTGTCSNCGKVYARKGRAQRFCSKSCYEVVAAKRAAKTAPVKVKLGPPLSTLEQGLAPKVCPICAVAHLRKSTLCSSECAAEENVRRNRNYYRAKVGLPLDNSPSKNFVRPKR